MGSSTREPRRPLSCPLLQHSPPRQKANLGKPQEDQAENGLGILGRGETRVRPKLVSRRPQAPLQRLCAGILFARGDPLHACTCRDEIGAASRRARRVASLSDTLPQGLGGEHFDERVEERRLPRPRASGIQQHFLARTRSHARPLTTNSTSGGVHCIAASTVQVDEKLAR